jgi:hypothetical protein
MCLRNALWKLREGKEPLILRNRSYRLSGPTASHPTESYIPVDRVLLHIYTNGDDINAFINLAVIPSYPEANLGFISLIIYSIS